MISKKLSNGYEMPGLAFGTWILPDEKEFETAINSALECGYRHIDTAYLYQNESLLGKILKKWLTSGKIKRDELFITSKLPMFGNNKDRVEKYITKSLADLQLDYVDMYLLHFPVATADGTFETPIQKLTADDTNHYTLWQKMQEQVELGRTRAIGLSNFNRKQIENILTFCRIPPSCLQIETHLFLQQKELVSFCQKNKIVVTGYAPIGTPGINKFLTSIGQDEKMLPNGLDHPLIKSVAEKYNKSASQVMLRYLIERDIIPIPKSCNPKRIKENIEVFDFVLCFEDMEQLETLDMGEQGWP
ncbi:unnamed protein product [Diabrotica balteata]|uniref:NADP-dependent oxidoreductase domain-containing protein n=1 Tax=Diabrotica balteata TaxID=107213 RepID=A0A9N9X872_DIABA|nr:unnamed protein product [Diabrotica balteata]